MNKIICEAERKCKERKANTNGSTADPMTLICSTCNRQFRARKVQVGKDQEKAQSEKDSHSKNRGGKKLN